MPAAGEIVDEQRRSVRIADARGLKLRRGGTAQQCAEAQLLNHRHVRQRFGFGQGLIDVGKREKRLAGFKFG